MQPRALNQDHHALLESYLRALGLPAFLELYQSYARDAARNGLSPEQFLWGRGFAEMADRDAKRIEMAIRRARFPFLKEISDYDFTAVENIPKTTILELAQGGYMDRAENLILVGKTHLGIGLAVAACRQGKRVRFYKAAALVNDLQVAQKKLTLSGFLARFVKLDLLVLDELGFIAVDKAGALLLFQLMSDLYEQVSVVIRSQLRKGSWNQIFADDKMTTAFLDRLTRHPEGSLSLWATRTAIVTASNRMEQRRNNYDSTATTRLVRQHFDGPLNCGEMDREGSVLLVCRHCASPLRERWDIWSFSPTDPRLADLSQGGI